MMKRETNNFVIDDTVGTLSHNKTSKMTLKYDMDVLDSQISLKVQSILNDIEDEVISETAYLQYELQTKKRVRSSSFYYRPQEMKTDASLNADEDNFEIEGTKQKIIDSLAHFNENDPVLCIMRRKKIRGVFLYKNSNVVRIESLDKKIFDFSYRQIGEDSIRFEREI